MKSGGQAGDFGGRVVDIETGPRAGGDAQAVVQGHSAMMAGANGDALHVEGFGNVVGMDAFHDEGDDASFALRFGAQDF